MLIGMPHRMLNEKRGIDEMIHPTLIWPVYEQHMGLAR